MLKFITDVQSRFIQDEDGATAIEYGLIAVGIAVAIIGIVATVGTDLSETFQTVSDGLQQANQDADGGS